MKTLGALLLVGALAGCTQTPAPIVVTKLVPVQPDIPPSLLVCASDPRIPVISTQADVAQYVAELWYAYQSCDSHLAGVRQLLLPPKNPKSTKGALVPNSS